MIINLVLTEDSKIQMTCDENIAVQGEKNITKLDITFPATIKNYSINNYDKFIEFKESKNTGTCTKFFDEITGDEYELSDIITQFRKIQLQFVLKNSVDEADIIIWKSNIAELEFGEAIDAEGNPIIQSQLLSLQEIEDEWEAELTEIEANWEEFVTDNCFRVIYRVSDIPEANASNVDKTIFYLGATTTVAPIFMYGHYYRCTLANSVYSWTDLTQDPSLEGVANGIREINNSQTMQLWVGTKAELEQEETQDNVMYIPEDENIKETFDEVLTEMAGDDDYKLAYPIKSIDSKLMLNNFVIPYINKLRTNANITIGTTNTEIYEISTEQLIMGETLVNRNLTAVFEIEHTYGALSYKTQVESRVFKFTKLDGSTDNSLSNDFIEKFTIMSSSASEPTEINIKLHYEQYFYGDLYARLMGTYSGYTVKFIDLVEHFK